MLQAPLGERLKLGSDLLDHLGLLLVLNVRFGTKFGHKAQSGRDRQGPGDPMGTLGQSQREEGFGVKSSHCGLGIGDDEMLPTRIAVARTRPRMADFKSGGKTFL